jgi:hypothetical protein
VSIFELLFLAAALAFLVGLGLAAAAAVRGRWARARRAIIMLAVAAGLYLAAGAAASYALPQRVMPMGALWCFDDWCLALDRIAEQPVAGQTAFVAEIRLVSRAGRISQRANGAWIYLVDAAGQRYEPVPDSSDLPLDVLLGPGETRAATRRFVLPAGVRPAGLVTGHGGPYCGVMDLLVIGNAGCFFGRPTMIGIGPSVLQ